MYVIGTAGHVDHGKSTLVRALTGIDPDRLAEEKAREMTIDLGFAWFTLGDDEVGVVDVPGHRDFIENMLAGVGGIDLALLVIAADEGVMPQTREHLAILDLLGIQPAVVALTKIDMVDDPEWIELVSLEIGLLLEGSSLGNAPIVPVSARTGAGLAELRQALTAALAQTEPRIDSGRPRLPIDRVFTLSGFGTIVTGTLLDGMLHVGDNVEVAPDELPGRIRGLQTHRTKRDVAHPGSRVAINLSGIERQDLRRGQVVALPGHLRPTKLIDAVYRHLPDASQPLRHNESVKVFAGSAEVSAHARVLGQELIAPGETGWVQLALAEPVAVVRGDRFILRRPSPGETIGGGQVLDANPGRRHRRFRPEVLARFTALQEGTPEEIILHALQRSGPATAATLSERTGLTATTVATALPELVDKGQVHLAEKLYVSAADWSRLKVQATETLARYHEDYPLRQGMNREELRNRLKIQPVAFNGLVGEMVVGGSLHEEGGLLRLPAHSIAFSPEQQAKVDQLLELLANSGVNSPGAADCQALVGEAVFAALVTLGTLVQIGTDIVYRADDYAQIVAALRQFLENHGRISAAQARDLLSTSRKYAIALLEHLDETRVTRRVGDERVLIAPKLP